MSKELECLERIDTKNYLTEREHKEFLGVVENALKRLEAIDNANPSEALKIFSKVDNVRLLFTNEERNTIKQALLKAEQFEKAYEDVKALPLESLIETYKQDIVLEVFTKEIGQLKKENAEYKKVLEIIKEKNVNVFGFKRDIKQLGKSFTYKYYQSNLGYYHSGFNIQELTKEEFNLLKEVLE